MSNEQKGNSFAYISIVALVAIVAIVVMFTGSGKSNDVVVLSSDSLVGDASARYTCGGNTYGTCPPGSECQWHHGPGYSCTVKDTQALAHLR